MDFLFSFIQMLRNLRRRGSKLRRGVALGLVLVLFVFLASVGHDHCHEDGNHQHNPAVAHLLCPDGCALAPLPSLPLLRLTEVRPRPDYAIPAPSGPLEAHREPEETPPRTGMGT